MDNTFYSWLIITIVVTVAVLIGSLVDYLRHRRAMRELRSVSPADHSMERSTPRECSERSDA